MDAMETLLVHNVLNEVLRGLPATARVRALLEQRSELQRLEALPTRSSAEYWTVPDRRLINECIETAIDMLGDDEFETRIGVEINRARLFAKRLLVRLG